MTGLRNCEKLRCQVKYGQDGRRLTPLRREVDDVELNPYVRELTWVLNSPPVFALPISLAVCVLGRAACNFEQYGQLARNGSIGPGVSNYSSVAVFLRNEILVHADHDDWSLRPQPTAPVRIRSFHCRPSSECPSTTTVERFRPPPELILSQSVGPSDTP